MELILFFIFGIFVGFTSGFFGIGGGAIVVAVLVFFGYDVKYAIGVSILQMCFSSIFGSYLNYKKGLFKVGESLYVGLGGLLGAAFSGLVVRFVPGTFLEILLASILSIGIAKSFLTKSFSDSTKNIGKPALIAIGAFTGVVGISAGIGGGIIISLIFFGLLGYDIKRSVSMGLFFVIFAAFSGAVSIALNVGIDYVVGSVLGIGALVGVYFGTSVQASIDRKIQKRLNICFNVIVLSLLLKKIFLG